MQPAAQPELTQNQSEEQADDWAQFINMDAEADEDGQPQEQDHQDDKAGVRHQQVNVHTDIGNLWHVHNGMQKMLVAKTCQSVDSPVVMPRLVLPSACLPPIMSTCWHDIIVAPASAAMLSCCIAIAPDCCHGLRLSVAVQACYIAASMTEINNIIVIAEWGRRSC